MFEMDFYLRFQAIGIVFTISYYNRQPAYTIHIIHMIMTTKAISKCWKRIIVSNTMSVFTFLNVNKIQVILSSFISIDKYSICLLTYTFNRIQIVEFLVNMVKSCLTWNESKKKTKFSILNTNQTKWQKDKCVTHCQNMQISLCTNISNMIWAKNWNNGNKIEFGLDRIHWYTPTVFLESEPYT